MANAHHGYGGSPLLSFVSYAVFVFGSHISLTNFYLSFLRYPIYRLRGGDERAYKWISGIPILGSLCIVVSMLLINMPDWLWWLGLILALLDTAGLHWFVAVMAYMFVTQRTLR